MVFETTIDSAGRVVIPQKVRRDLHLLPGTRLRVQEHGRGVMLEPIASEPLLVVRDGIKLIGSTVEGAVPSAPELREEWLEGLSGRVRKGRKSRPGK